MRTAFSTDWGDEPTQADAIARNPSALHALAGGATIEAALAAVACEHCNRGPSAYECEPCDACAKVVDASALTWGADCRWRCAPCHLRADLKLICAERPAFTIGMGLRS